MSKLPAYVTDDVRERIVKYLKKCEPQEGCGLILRYPSGDFEFKPMLNVHYNPVDHFSIDARDIATATENNVAIMAVVHSHPRSSSDPSAHDRSSMDLHQKPFLIVGMFGDISWNEPKRAPLVGRMYVHGTQDCYGIVRDFYARELGIVIQDMEREDRWWEDASKASLYIDNFEAFGFVRVPKSDLRRGDVLLCRWGQTAHVNHALIYLADDPTLNSENTSLCIGARLCLHHPYNGVSGRILLGETRLELCEYVVRHRTLMQ